MSILATKSLEPKKSNLFSYRVHRRESI